MRKVNFGRLTQGVLHSKFWIVDRKHVFIGSANMDWRALTQVNRKSYFQLKNPWPHNFVILFYVYRLRNWEWSSTTVPVWQRTSIRSSCLIGRWESPTAPCRSPGLQSMTLT